MALLKPTRLPRRLNRQASAYTRAVARHHYRKASRASHRRREWLSMASRRWSKTGGIILKELKLWIIGMAALGVITAMAVLLFSPIFHVREIQVRRQDARVDVDEVQSVLKPLFEERMFFVTKAQVQTLLLERFPDITRIGISKAYPSTLTVTVFTDPLVAELKIDESQPMVGSGAINVGSGSYAYVTSKGFAIVAQNVLTKEPLPIITVTDWGVRPSDRAPFLPQAMLKTIFDARATLEDSFGMQVKGTTVFLRANEFHIQTQRGVSLWFDMASPLGMQFGRFREFLRALSLDQAKEYIDLRISDRVIYK